METIELSIGTVKIKELTNKVYNKALARATVIENGVNNAVFLNYCERKMTCIPFWKWGKLTIKDGTLLREKIVSMLKVDGIIKEEKEVVQKEDSADFNNISKEDVQWFSAQAARQKAMMKGG